ncbi:MAG: hypothetical protein AB8H79_20950, partial [Myxococcota bacterium]
MSLRMVSPLTWLMLSACIQPVGLGPDMGPCAAPPDGAYTFGEVGIGTCLAGPTDLQFARIDGKDWLLVSNSDPFENFSSGSLLVVDWDSVDPTLPTQFMHTLDAASTTLPRSNFDPDDDLAGDRYLGSIGVVLDRPDGVPLALVPSRYSGESITTDTEDHLRVVDLSDPSAPNASVEHGDGLLLGGDPTQVAVVGDRAFVSHLFDQDLAVIDVHASPIERVLVGQGATVLPDTFTDGDDSGSSATLSLAEVVSPSLFVDETWTLTRVDASWRVWVPEEGLQRWEVGQDAVVVAPTGPDLPLTDTTPPYTGAFAALDANGSPALLFGQDGNLRQAQVSAATQDLSDWIVSSDVLLRAGTGDDAWNAFIDAPSVADSPNGEDAILAYDGRLADGEPASIGIAIAQTSGDESNLFVKQAQPALIPGDGLSLEDPFVRTDVYLGGLRM